MIEAYMENPEPVSDTGGLRASKFWRSCCFFRCNGYGALMCGSTYSPLG